MGIGLTLGAIMAAILPLTRLSLLVGALLLRPFSPCPYDVRLSGRRWRGYGGQMINQPVPAVVTHHLLYRLAELDQSSKPEEPWRIEQEPHDYPDGTTHFTHVRTTGYVQGEPVLVSIGK